MHSSLQMLGYNQSDLNSGCTGIIVNCWLLTVEGGVEKLNDSWVLTRPLAKINRTGKMPIPQEKITLVGWASCPSHQLMKRIFARGLLLILFYHSDASGVDMISCPVDYPNSCRGGFTNNICKKRTISQTRPGNCIMRDRSDMISTVNSQQW